MAVTVNNVYCVDLPRLFIFCRHGRGPGCTHAVLQRR